MALLRLPPGAVEGGAVRPLESAKIVVNPPLLLHEIARWALSFITVPAEVRERAETGFLTPEDCLLIADQLARLGRALSSFDEAKEATRLAHEMVEANLAKPEAVDLQAILQTIPRGSEKHAWLAYFQLFIALTSLRGPRPSA